MKAENILNSNLRRKSTVVHMFFCKNWIFKNYRLYFDEKKIFERKFFKKIFIQPPKSISLLFLNTKNEIYMKV